jgi:hypothetical protein
MRIAVAGLIAMTAAGLQAAPQDAASKMTKTTGKADQFSAVAVNIEAPAGMAAVPIDILVERYSTPAERDLVYNTMLEAPKQLLNVIQKLPRVGAIRGASSIGWDLRYAWRTPGPNNTERVTIITDRPISFWEAANQPRTIDYPFTVIELRIGSNGRGEGRMAVGAKVSMDKETKTIVLENFNATTVMLNDVRREK